MECKRTLSVALAIAIYYSFALSCDEELPVLNDLDRRGVTNIWDGGESTIVTDHGLISGWYRTIYNGWQYKIVDENNLPGYQTCSSYWPIYVSGSHISVELGEEPRDVTLCLRDASLSPCSTTYQIQVRNCSGEIQYRLRPTAWYSAYCFEKAFKVSTLGPAPENVLFGGIKVVPELTFNKELIDSQNWTVPYVEFRCTFDAQTDLFYSVTWYIDNTVFGETMGPSKNLSNLNLHENHLISNNKSLGIQIKCGVTASATIDGLQTPEKFSPQFYAGIKVLNSTIYLDKQSSGKVQMVSTVPIGCKYRASSTETFRNLICRSEMKLFVDDKNPLTCERYKKGTIYTSTAYTENQFCAKFIKTLAENNEFQPDNVFDFDIVTTDHTYDDVSNFNLKLQFGQTMRHQIWKDYFFPDIKIVVQNTTLYKSKVCKSINDPHMTTFDGYRYEQQQDGTYILYKHMKNQIEVQQQLVRCGRATCTCGVAVSAGQDIFMINRCSKIWFLGFTQCGDGGILEVVRIHDYLYRVFTPIGTRVEISLSGSNLINVEVYLAPKDMNNVEGLCGKADGIIANDLKHRNSDTHSPLGSGWRSHHTSFAASWRVQDSDENLFSHTFKTRERWSQQNNLYCVCSNEATDEALCSATQYLKCSLTGSITKTKCHVEGRRKRNTGNHSDKEVRRLLASAANNVHRKKRQDETSDKVIITSEATEVCTKILNGSRALNDFKNIRANDDKDIVIAWCAFDISNDNKTAWAEQHCEAANDGVKNMIDLQPIYAANHIEEIADFDKNTCPMNCNDRGNCTDSGVCSCLTYYRGPDCSIDERDGLKIRDIQGDGECDLIDGDECECFYVRSDSIQDNFTCQVNTSKIHVDGHEEFVSSYKFKGGFEDIFTGICCVQENIIGSENVFVAKYSVAISNNGINFGNIENVHVFDSKCQEVEDNLDSSNIFTLKDQHCFIDGYCVADGEMTLVGCLTCNSSISKYNWTAHNPCKNGGNCRDDTSGYTCGCMEGYGGMNCEYEVNECDSTPCMNGGYCLDEFNGYTCTCEAEFTGTHCEINIKNCHPNPCQNGGSCANLIGGFICTCMEGFNGSNCEINIDECLTNPCQNGGSCVDAVNNYECTCVAGYTGTNCKTDINECLSNPCQNGGSCRDALNMYVCSCLDGYTGSMCETDINGCLSSPCQNDGSCVDAINAYTCTCKSGFTGTDCETDINECSSNPCQNAGKCVDVINMYSCTCDAGYTGTNCETDINECSSNPCQNGGSCMDGINRYTCTCVSGYTGTYCKTDVDDCVSNPCQNGGICEDLLNGRNCTCLGGFDGIHCEKNIDECSSNPCKNDGSCFDAINMYECACIAGYTGTQCETEINECSSNPCQNSGGCYDGINKYTCTCDAGYTGTDCETEINECSSNPCQNGGSCADTINMYTCTCATGYTGTDCETDIDECLPNPCKNGGSCTDGVDDVTCTCTAGYNGTDCSTEINECSSNPCQNGGKCVNEINHFTCTCASGYDGTKCEIEINECSSNPCQNGGTCVDEIDQFSCTCAAGYDGTNCEIAKIVPTTTEIPGSATLSISLVFPLTTNNIDLKAPNVLENIRIGLMRTFQQSLRNMLIDIRILQLRKGSLIVDVEVIYYNDANAASDLTKAMTDLVGGDTTTELLNETLSATSVQLGDLTVTNDSLRYTRVLCDIFIAVRGACSDSSQCASVDGNPSCVLTRSKSNLTLVIVVVVSTVTVLVVVLAILCVAHRSYRIREKKRNTKSSNLDKGQLPRTISKDGDSVGGRTHPSDSYCHGREYTNRGSFTC